jgi:multidrug resistance efflux pump
MVMENGQTADDTVMEPEDGNNSPAPETEDPAREVEAERAAVAEMKEALAARDTEIAALNRSLSGEREAAAALGKALAGAVAAYREVVVRANPGVLEEMVTGDSVEKVNASLESARALTEKVKREIETEAARTRIPAGAPPRVPPDISALSAREKIQDALGGQ